MTRPLRLSSIGAALPPVYIEDVFSTYLYTGNGSTQTINNGIDLAGKGGLVWCKGRQASIDHVLFDTARGAYNALLSDYTGGQSSFSPYGVTAFNADGFSIADISNGSYGINGSAGGAYSGANAQYVSWTFRKQPKFFDVVTYTGNGSSVTFNHNLQAVPGCVIIKHIDAGDSWYVWHRTFSSGDYIFLDSTGAKANNSNLVLSASSTQITVTSPYSTVNASGGQYVAYLFAHNAGGFGLTGTDNVISCGITDSGGNATLGYEPQWILAKDPNNVDNWKIIDTMRGWPNGYPDNYLFANTSGAEGTNGGLGHPTATGFTLDGGTHIYIAIRRGPMKTPTSGTSVFAPVTRAGTSAAASVNSVGFPPDLTTLKVRNGGSQYNFIDRLRGREVLYSTSTMAAIALNPGVDTAMESNIGFSFIGSPENVDCNYSGLNDVYHNFRRAPSFFDEVCYTGTGSATTFAHNLAAVPELMIVKGRTGGFTSWHVYSAASANANDFLRLQTTGAWATDANIFGARPTSTVFSVGASSGTNGSGTTYVAYLFASCPGVSKVGSYTGNGSTQTINCGFTGGARFVLIKRTDSTGDWYVWDTARGIVSGNDPYLLLNSTAAEVTSTDYIDTYSAGFEISSTAPAAINASGGTFIYLAIA